MAIPTYKKIQSEEEFNSIVNYCKSWANHYFSYFQINNYSLTDKQIERLKNELIRQGFKIKEHINSHNVPCFWVLK